MAESKQQEKKLKNKPTDSPFKQQRLKAWQPILTPNWVVGTFALIGIVFVPIGAWLISTSDGVSLLFVCSENGRRKCNTATVSWWNEQER